MPEIAAGNEAVGEALSNVVQPTPLLDLGIFLVALAGFTAFYGLERLAERHGDVPPAVGSEAIVAGAAEPSPSGAGGVYWLHLSAFLIYNALITYTMALRLRTGVAFAVLFTIAMGLHFTLTDRGHGGGGPAGAGLGLGGEVASPEVDVVAFGGQRVDTKLEAPAGQGLQVAAVGGGGVGRVTDQPAGGQAEERVVGARAGQPIQRLRPDRQHCQSERRVERGQDQSHRRNVSRRHRQDPQITSVI